MLEAENELGNRLDFSKEIMSSKNNCWEVTMSKLTCLFFVNEKMKKRTRGVKKFLGHLAIVLQA